VQNTQEEAAAAGEAVDNAYMDSEESVDLDLTLEVPRGEDGSYPVLRVKAEVELVEVEEDCEVVDVFDDPVPPGGPYDVVGSQHPPSPTDSTDEETFEFPQMILLRGQIGNDPLRSVEAQQLNSNRKQIINDKLFYSFLITDN